MLLIAKKEFGHIVLKTVIRGVTKNVFLRFATQTFGKAVLFLSKIAMSAVSVVTVVFAIGAVFDLIFSIWDPFNYNKMFPKDLPRDMLNRV